MKVQIINQKKIFALNILLKGLLSRVYKEVSKLNKKNTNNSFKNTHTHTQQAKGWMSLFTEGEIQMASKHMKKFDIMSN